MLVSDSQSALRTRWWAKLCPIVKKAAMVMAACRRALSVLLALPPTPAQLNALTSALCLRQHQCVAFSAPLPIAITHNQPQPALLAIMYPPLCPRLPQDPAIPNRSLLQLLAPIDM